MAVTITGLSFDYVRGATCYVRFYADSEWVDSDGIHHPSQPAGGRDYLEEVACTASGGVASGATFTLPATHDVRTGGEASVTAYILDSNRNKVSILASNLRIPSPPATTTWANLLVANSIQVHVRDDSTYTKPQVDYRIADAVNVGNPATALAIGRLRASATPTDAAAPTALVDGDARMGKSSADYASLSAAVSAIGSTPTDLYVVGAFASGASCTVPSTLTLKFVQGGSIVLGSGHTVAVASDASDWPVAQIFSGSGTVTLAGASTIYPEWWGAVGDNSTDDAVAFNKCFAAALNGNSDKTVRLGAKVYVIGSALTVGSASRTIGITIVGSGKYATRLRWTGNTSDFVLTVRNIQYPTLRDFGIEGTTVAGGGIHYKVDDGTSGSGPITERVYVSNVSVGMLIGGGALLSSGQANSGEHTSVSFDSCVTGVKLTGANTEVQSFYNLTMGGAAMTKGFHLLNGRGLYVKNADISLNTASYHIPFFVELDGGSGYAHGGGFAFEDMRMEGMAGFFWSHIDNPALPLTLRLTNVSCASEPVGSSAPHDILKLDTGNWSVAVRNSIFLAAQSRFSFLNLNQIRYIAFVLEGCQINNGFGGTTPDADPTVLLNITRDAALSPAATGGIRVHMRANLLTATSGVYQPVRNLADRMLYATDLDISTGTLNKLGPTLSGSATWNPASIADGAMTSTTLTVTGAVVGDTVSVGFSVAVPAGAQLTGQVTAADTVTVTLLNHTGGALDLASGTLRADVVQH